jgi:hypothetical protein
MNNENTLRKDKHILIYEEKLQHPSLDYLINNFCGKVVSSNIDDYTIFSPGRMIYICGNVQQIYPLIKNTPHKKIYIIKDLSSDYHSSNAHQSSDDYGLFEDYEIITIGMVPINIHGMGVYFRKFFNDDTKNYFREIKNSHAFQSLTESNKQGVALRKGLYLSKVEKVNATDDDVVVRDMVVGDMALTFNLLRCSTNLEGPTDNFRDIDHEIIDKVNYMSQYYFKQRVSFNHVLAQCYDNNKQIKAKISAHSDKTKDMPANGLIAFCTFYEDNKTKPCSVSKMDEFDIEYKQISVLTKLHFKLKQCVQDENLVKTFSVTLYPNSVFIIPLSTNRLYTHEIKPSILDGDMIPTRLGYVIRCSNTNAIFKNGVTMIDNGKKHIKLEKITVDDTIKLRELYYAENSTAERVDYGDIYFSMNNGDYMEPKI